MELKYSVVNCCYSFFRVAINFGSTSMTLHQAFKEAGLTEYLGNISFNLPKVALGGNRNG